MNFKEPRWPVASLQKSELSENQREFSKIVDPIRIECENDVADIDEFIVRNSAATRAWLKYVPDGLFESEILFSPWRSNEKPRLWVSRSRLPAVIEIRELPSGPEFAILHNTRESPAQ